MNTDVRCVTSGQPGKLPSAHADSCPMIAWSKRCFCRPWTALAEYQSNGEMGYIRYKEAKRKNLQTSPNIFGKVKIDKIGGGWQMKTLCRVLWVCLESLVLTVCGTLRVSYSRFSMIHQLHWQCWEATDTLPPPPITPRGAGPVGWYGWYS